MGRSIRYSWLVICLVSSAFISCKTTQPIATNHPDQHFVISLYSIGAGINQEARSIVNNVIMGYQKKGYNITYTDSHWGREGEVDYCFTLQKLDPIIYKDFFDRLTRLLEGKQAHIKDKGECMGNN